MIALEDYVRHAAAVLGQRYSDLNELAQGKSGIVFSARTKDGKPRRVAIKVAHPHYASKELPDSVVRFRRESEIGAQLQHEHILRASPIETLEGIEFYEMDLPGPYRVDHLVLASHPPTFERILAVMREIADAVDYAHSLGIVHGALHPSNILLDENGHARVKRFLLREGERPKHPALSPAAIGDPAYMAPEQWRLATIDRRADVYAAGVLAYELCTGERRVIYDVPGVPEIRPIELPANRALRDGIPFHVNAAIRHATSKDREGRYKSLAAFISALEHPEEALGHSLPTALPARVKKRGTHVVLIAAVAIAVTGSMLSFPSGARDSLQRLVQRASRWRAPNFDPITVSSSGSTATSSGTARIESPRTLGSERKESTPRDSTVAALGSGRREASSRKESDRERSSLGATSQRQPESPERKGSGREGAIDASTGSSPTGTTKNASTGILKVTVDQGRVVVLVNGIPRGFAPVTLSLGAGTYRVSVKGNLKYDPSDLRINVSLGDTAFAEFYATDAPLPDTSTVLARRSTASDVGR